MAIVRVVTVSNSEYAHIFAMADSSKSVGLRPGDGTAVMRLDEVLESIPLGMYHYRLLVICGMAFMSDAMEVTLLSFLSICAGASWDLSNSQVATISSSVFVGILAGNLFWGPFADKYGRRMGFLLGASIIILFGVLTGFATNYYMLLAFRITVGFGLGGATIPFDLLAEFLPQSARGRFLININYFWVLGSMFVAGVAWIFLSEEGWHFLAIVTSIPVGVSMAWAIFVLPESPRWLLQVGRVEEAEEVLRLAAAYNNFELPKFKLKPPTIINEEDVSYSEFFKRDMLPITIPLWSVWCCFGFLYYGIVLLISRLFAVETDDDGYNCDFDYKEIFISAVSELGGVIICAFLVDRIGRVKIQMGFYLSVSVGVLLIGIKMPDALLILFGTIARMCAMGATIVTWVATPELFPTRVRASGHSIASSIGRLGAFCVPFLVSSAAPIFVVCTVISVVSLVAAISVYFLPETKDLRMDSRAISSAAGTKNPLIDSLQNELEIEKPRLISRDVVAPPW